MSARNLTWAAMFVALTLVFDQLPAPPGKFGNLFRFIGFPVILSGLVLGPTVGFLVGAVSDVLGYLIGPPPGPYFPGFTLTQATTGALPAFLFSWMNRSRPTEESRWTTLLKLTLAILVTKLLCSVVLVSFFLSKLYGIDPLLHAGPALLVALVHCPLYAWLSLPLMRSLRRLRPGVGWS
ncbi:MAG: hypothetical protein AMXMBFR33_00130 [Candidatus Xenobia bacterium]